MVGAEEFLNLRKVWWRTETQAEPEDSEGLVKIKITEMNSWAWSRSRFPPVLPCHSCFLEGQALRFCRNATRSCSDGDANLLLSLLGLLGAQ